MLKGLVAVLNNQKDPNSKPKSYSQDSRQGAESIVSSSSGRTPSLATRSDDRDHPERVYIPTSTSYASTMSSSIGKDDRDRAGGRDADRGGRGDRSSKRDSDYDENYRSRGSTKDRSNDSDKRRDRDRNNERGSRRERSRSKDRGGRDKGGSKRDRSTSRDRRDRRGSRRDRSRSRDRADGRKDYDRDDRKRETREEEKKRDKKNRDRIENERGIERAGPQDGSNYSAQASGAFGPQAGGQNSTQFQGQYNGSGPQGPGFKPPSSTAPKLSSQVPDQFPGQFPAQSTAPYRPPLSVEEGGPGLASDYYGDQGQSVLEQPGVRPKPPSLIVGAEPHLQAASPIDAPPLEPSATGGVGAAADYFSGADFGSGQPSTSTSKPPSKPGKPGKPGKPSKLPDTTAAIAGSAALGYVAAGAATGGGNSVGSTSYQQGSKPPSAATSGYPLPPVPSSTEHSSAHPAYTYPPPPPVPVPPGYSDGYLPATAPTSGSGQHFAPSPVVPAIGAAAAGAAVGYLASHSGPPSQQQQQQHASNSSYRPQVAASVPPSSYVSASSTPSASSKPLKPGKHSPSHSNAGLYAAGAVGLGAAALAHHNSHHNQSSEHYSVAGSTYSTGTGGGGTGGGGSVALQQRRRGPVGKIIDFWRDPEGVARFEDYTEAIGVCRYCFETGSTSRDAPRKHHYHSRRRGSNERLSERYGSSTRVDKDSRYSSSDNAAGHRHRARGKKSLIATGLGVYGLARLGKTLFGKSRHFDESYSVQSNRSTGSGRWSFFQPRNTHSPDRASRASHSMTIRSRSRSRDRSSHHSGHRSSHRTSSHTAASAGALAAGALLAGSSHSPSKSSKHRSRSRSRDRKEIGITRDGHVYKRETHRGLFGGTTTTTYADPNKPKHRRRRSRSRSRSRDKHSGLLGTVAVASAGAAALSSRSKHHDRSRSNSPKHRRRSSGGRYSPRSQTSTSNVARSSTASIFRSIFSTQPERPERKHRARKKRGFFSFGNSSSSSSDFGLVYGPGSERRQRRRSRSAKGKDHRGTDAAMVGLGTAATLIAASEIAKSNHDKKGRRRSEDAGRKETSHHKRSSRRSSSSSSSEEDDWESDRDSSEDSNLAFGSFHDSKSTTSRRSQDSLRSDASSGSGNWLWPWGGKRSKGKKPKETIYPSDSVSHGGSFTSPAASGLIGATAGALAGAAIASGGRRESPSSSAQGSLRKVHPISTPDHGIFDATRHSSISSSHTQPILTSQSAPIPILHPKPFVPVSQAVYSSQGPPPSAVYPPDSAPYQPSYSTPSGPPVFSTVPPVQRAHSGPVPPQGEALPPTQRMQSSADPFKYQVRDDSFVTRGEENRIPSVPQRRASSPTIVTVEPLSSSTPAREARDPTTGVRFKLTQEQTERQSRDRKYSDSKSRDDKNRGEQGRNRGSREKGRSDSWAGPATAGAIGAAVGAFAAGDAASRTKERGEVQQNRDRDQFQETTKPNRGYHPKKDSQSDQSDRQSDIARKAAAKIIANQSNEYSNVPSVVDKYNQKGEPAAVYVAPPEPLEMAKETPSRTSADRDGHYNDQRYQEYHDSAAYTGDVLQPGDIQAYHAPEVVATAPRGPPYSPGYSFTATKDGMDSSYMSPPWPVPGLNLIHPTPPGSVAGGSWKGPVSVPGTPVMTPVVVPVTPSSAIPPIDPVETKSQPSGSKVSQEEPKTREYSTEARSDTREAAIVDPPTKSAKRQPSKVSTGSTNKTTIRRVEERTSDQMPGSFKDDIEFAATVAAGLEKSGFDPSIVIDNPTYYSPGSEEEEYVTHRKTPNIPADTSSYHPLEYPKPVAAPPQKELIDSDEDEDTEPQGASLPGRYVDEFEPKPEKKPSKKERKEQKRQMTKDREAKRQSVSGKSVQDAHITTLDRDIVAEPESYFEEKTTDKKSRKPKRDSVSRDRKDTEPSTKNGASKVEAPRRTSKSKSNQSGSDVAGYGDNESTTGTTTSSTVSTRDYAESRSTATSTSRKSRKEGRNSIEGGSSTAVESGRTTQDQYSKVYIPPLSGMSSSSAVPDVLLTCLEAPTLTDTRTLIEERDGSGLPLGVERAATAVVDASTPPKRRATKGISQQRALSPVSEATTMTRSSGNLPTVVAVAAAIPIASRLMGKDITDVTQAPPPSSKDASILPASSRSAFDSRDLPRIPPTRTPSDPSPHLVQPRSLPLAESPSSPTSSPTPSPLESTRSQPLPSEPTLSLDGLPTLPPGAPSSLLPYSVQPPPLPTESALNLNDLPAPPAHSPTLPTLEPAQPRSVEPIVNSEDYAHPPSDHPLPVTKLRSLPFEPAFDLVDLPALPSSVPSSPPPESIQPRSLSSEPILSLDGLPPLPASRPSSPLLETVKPPPEPTLSLDDLPPLPLSGPSSPIREHVQPLPEPAFSLVDLPALPPSNPSSPLLETVQSRSIPTEHGSDDFPALPSGSPTSPSPESVPVRRSSETALDLTGLPALPISRPSSPYSKPEPIQPPPKPSHDLDLLPLETALSLGDLPALPPSTPSSPLLETLPSHSPDVIPSEAAPSLSDLPALPPSTPPSPLLETLPSDGSDVLPSEAVRSLGDLPAFPPSTPSSPLLETLPAHGSDVLPSEAAPSLDSLPALPPSIPSSPLLETLPSHGSDVLPSEAVRSLGSLPALPPSTPPSPLLETLPSDGSDILPSETAPGLGHLSSLPLSTPSSPLLETLQTRSISSESTLSLDRPPTLPFSRPPSIPEAVQPPPRPLQGLDALPPKAAINLVDLPPLPASEPPSPSLELAPFQRPPLDLSSLPALPASGPPSPHPEQEPVESPSEAMRSLGNLPILPIRGSPALPSKLVQSRSLPSEPAIILAGLPPLPESGPSSPILESETAQPPEPAFDLNELPALPTSGPASPSIEPIQQLPPSPESGRVLYVLPTSRPSSQTLPLQEPTQVHATLEPKGVDSLRLASSQPLPPLPVEILTTSHSNLPDVGSLPPLLDSGPPSPSLHPIRAPSPTSETSDNRIVSTKDTAETPILTQPYFDSSSAELEGPDRSLLSATLVNEGPADFDATVGARSTIKKRKPKGKNNGSPTPPLTEEDEILPQFLASRKASLAVSSPAKVLDEPVMTPDAPTYTTKPKKGKKGKKGKSAFLPAPNEEDETSQTSESTLVTARSAAEILEIPQVIPGAPTPTKDIKGKKGKRKAPSTSAFVGKDETLESTPQIVTNPSETLATLPLAEGDEAPLTPLAPLEPEEIPAKTSRKDISDESAMTPEPSSKTKENKKGKKRATTLADEDKVLQDLNLTPTPSEIPPLMEEGHTSSTSLAPREPKTTAEASREETLDHIATVPEPSAYTPKKTKRDEKYRKDKRKVAQTWREENEVPPPENPEPKPPAPTTPMPIPEERELTRAATTSPTEILDVDQISAVPADMMKSKKDATSTGTFVGIGESPQRAKMAPPTTAILSEISPNQRLKEAEEIPLPSPTAEEFEPAPLTATDTSDALPVPALIEDESQPTPHTAAPDVLPIEALREGLSPPLASQEPEIVSSTRSPSEPLDEIAVTSPIVDTKNEPEKAKETVAQDWTGGTLPAGDCKLAQPITTQRETLPTAALKGDEIPSPPAAQEFESASPPSLATIPPPEASLVSASKEIEIPLSPPASQESEATHATGSLPEDLNIPPISISQERDKAPSPLLTSPTLKEISDAPVLSLTSKGPESVSPTKTGLTEILPTPAPKEIDEVSSRDLEPALPAEGPAEVLDDLLTVADAPTTAPKEKKSKKKDKKDKKGKKKVAQTPADGVEIPPSPPIADELELTPPVATNAAVIPDEPVTASVVPPQKTKPEKGKKGKKDKKDKKRASQTLIEEETTPPLLASKEPELVPSATASQVEISDEPKGKTSSPPLAQELEPASAKSKKDKKKDKKRKTAATPALEKVSSPPLAQEEPESRSLPGIVDESIATAIPLVDSKPEKDKDIKIGKALEKDETQTVTSPAGVPDESTIITNLPVHAEESKNDKRGKATVPSNEKDEISLVTASLAKISDEPATISDSPVFRKTSAEVQETTPEKTIPNTIDSLQQLSQDHQITPNPKAELSTTILTSDRPRGADPATTETTDYRQTQTLTKTASPTAVPIFLRRPPISPSVNRSPFTLPSTPQGLSIRTPRTRGSRPNSTEIRPLYLVERHKSRQEIEQEETYPSLPSSRTTSRSPSLHDEDALEAAKESKGSPQGARQDISLWKDHHEELVQDNPDLGISVDRSISLSEPSREPLDSGQSTPKAASFSQVLHDDAEYMEQEHGSADPQMSHVDQESPSRGLSHGPVDSLSSIGDISSLLDRSNSPYSKQQQHIGTRSVEEWQNESFISSLQSLPQSRPGSPYSKQESPKAGPLEAVEKALPWEIPPGSRMSRSISPYSKEQERIETSSIEPMQTEVFTGSLPSFSLDRSASPSEPTEARPVEVAQSDLSIGNFPSPSLGKSTSPYSEQQRSPMTDSVDMAQGDSTLGTLPRLPFPFTRSDSLHSERQYGTSTTSSDPLNISVELGSSYELSVSRPHRDHFESDSAPSVEVFWNPRDWGAESAPQDQTATQPDMGIARSRSIEDLPEPSPVESTSKERDSMLFKSPPAKNRLEGSPSPRPSPDSAHRGRSKEVVSPARDTAQLKETQRRTPPDADHSPSPQPRGLGNTQTPRQVQLDMGRSSALRPQEIDDVQARRQVQIKPDRFSPPRPGKFEDTQRRVQVGTDRSPSPQPREIGDTQAQQQIRTAADHQTAPRSREVDDMQTQRRAQIGADTPPNPRRTDDAQAHQRVQTDIGRSPSPRPREVDVAHTSLYRSRAPEGPSPPPTTRRSPPSLFGGPIGTSNDTSEATAPTRSIIGIAASEKRRLGTITESSPDDSPLSKKGRSIPGPEPTGHAARHELPSISPEIPLDHDRSPPAEPTSHNLTHPAQHPTSRLISTDDPLSRRSWPAVDENAHTVDIDRTMSRGPDSMSPSRLSNVSPITPDRPPAREATVRSPTGHSARSPTSINWHKTPENTRDRDKQHRPSSVLSNPNRPTSALSNRAGSVLSNRSLGLIETARTPPRTPPLRRVDRSVSGDLRAASKREEGKLARDPPPELFLASSSTYDPLKDKGKGRARDMADVYEGWGDVQGSPLSPTRPASIMRRRHSMQLMDMETRIDELVSANRLLAEGKAKAEESLENAMYNQQRGSAAQKEALETRDLEIRTKDAEIGQLKETLELVQKEVTKLTEVNASILALNASLTAQSLALRSENTSRDQRLEEATEQLENLRREHGELTSGMEAVVRHEINVALEEKDAQLRRLRDELSSAKEQVRSLQRQIMESRGSENFLVTRDEDYFEAACQTLCQHMKEWVLRFSKFSDGKQCRLLDDIEDDKIRDQVDSTILDDTDVNNYLSDRVKRRDVFMSVVMIMVWEYIFTRYLFGMDREQRQKLKALEKILAEVGPQAAVHQWRATTLTLLSHRPSFLAQRAQDTEAVVQEIYHTLSALLPPPPSLVSQILDSLRNVMRSAVDLSIEMRTQRAEYMMLPPLRPEYDQNGDLLRKIYFNALTMNERSGEVGVSNEDLEDQQAVVRIVLFPLVVKKGDQTGAGEEEIVVCPAQVLVAKPASLGKEKQVARVVSGDRMTVDAPLPTASAQSIYSTLDMGMGGMI